MATFGRYEQVREISVTGIGSVWTARLGDAAPAFVVKTYQPTTGVLADDQVAQGIRSFLECARAQQQAAAAEGSRWAPVHEVGEVPGGAYYVTDHYPWSVKRLTSGRVPVDAAAVYAIADGVARGLAQIKDCCGRPHGNLTSANVMLDGAPGASATRVFLADPAEPRRVGNDGAEANDLYALGQILFELITHRQAKRMMQWPIPAGAEWSALGGKADGWRELCNQLLHPVPEESLRRLEDLTARLADLAAGGRRSGKPLVVVGGVAAAVLLLAAGSAAYFLGNGRHKPVVVVPTGPHGGNGFVKDPVGSDGPPTRPTDTDVAGREAAEKAFELWKGRIAAPSVESPVLRKAWEDARKTQLASRTGPDPAVKSRLDDLREDLQSLERDLSTVNATGATNAAAEREKLYAKAAKVIAEDASASDPTAMIWQSLRGEYGTWLKHQGDVRRADELVKTASSERDQGHDRVALNKLAEALAVDSTNAKADELKQQIEKDEARAIAEASAAAADGKDLPGVLTRLGALLNRDPDLTEAKALSESISLRMDGAKADETMLKTALDQHLQNSDGAALGTLEQLLKRNPQNKEARNLKAEILKLENQMLTDASALEDANELQKARSKLTELLTRNPGRADATQIKQGVEKKLAQALLSDAQAKKDSGDWPAALAALDGVDQITPGDAGAIKLRKDVDTLVQNHEKVGRLLADGQKLMGESDWNRAVDALKNAAVLEPANKDVQVRLAAATERLKAYQEKLLHDKQVMDALAQAKGQIAAVQLREAEATLNGPGIDPALPAVQALFQEIKTKQGELDKAALNKAHQLATSGDLGGADAIVARFDQSRADVRTVAQEIKNGREQLERKAQAETLARATLLSQQATTDLKAGDPVKAEADLKAAENARVTAAVKPKLDEIHAKVDAAPTEFARGNDFYQKNKYKEALESYLNAAEGGNANAMFSLGDLYLKGWGAAKNPTEAALWLRRAAVKGNSDAMYEVATLYETGQGVPASAETATNFYQQAAKAGNKAAINLLAVRTARANTGTGSTGGTSSPRKDPFHTDLVP